MPKQYYRLSSFSSLNDIQDPRDIKDSELSQAQNVMVDKKGAIRTMGSSTSHADVENNDYLLAPGWGLYYFGSDHIKGSSAVDTGENWLTVCDSKNCQIDLYDETSDAWTTAVIDLGTVNTYTPGAGKIDFPTTSTITDSDSGFISTFKVKKGDIIKVSGCTTERANNLNAVVVTKVVAGTITVYGTPFTVEATEAGSVTLAVLTKAVYHFAGEALRVADASFSENTQSKWYGYVDRKHFYNSSGTQLTPGNSANTYDNWSQKDNTLAAPTRGIVGTALGGDPASSDTADDVGTSDINTLACAKDNFPSTLESELDSGTYIAVNRTQSEVQTISSRTDVNTLETGNLDADVWDDDEYAIYPAAGTGFVLDMSTTASGGTWAAGTYEFAITFIYDGNQESLPKTLDGTLTTVENDSIECFVFAYAPYDERITGGKIYHRDSTEKGEWIFFGEINMRDGAKSTFDGEYDGWTLEYANSLPVYCSFTSKSENVENYKVLNGFSSQEAAIDIGATGEGYATSVITNRRCFIANVKTRNEDGVTMHMRDRIMYSPVNKFDTFPRSYFIDVVQGDAEEYVHLDSFNDRLLAFKQNTLYIINIASPTSSGWFLEATHDFMGVKQPYAVFKTDMGVIWINKMGCFFYDGNNIQNLIKNKIDETNWQSFITDYSQVGYDAEHFNILVQKDVTSESTADLYIYLFNIDGWVTGISVFTDSRNESNFVTDWNNKLSVAQEGNAAGTGIFLQWRHSSSSQTQNEIVVRTKDIDFGIPEKLKRIYGGFLTYKSTAAQTTPIAYDTNGGTSFGSNFTGDFTDTSGAWDILNFTLASPVNAQSIALQIKNTVEGASKIDINDIQIEYRPLYKNVS